MRQQAWRLMYPESEYPGSAWNPSVHPPPGLVPLASEVLNSQTQGASSMLAGLNLNSNASASYSVQPSPDSSVQAGDSVGLSVPLFFPFAFH